MINVIKLPSKTDRQGFKLVKVLYTMEKSYNKYILVYYKVKINNTASSLTGQLTKTLLWTINAQHIYMWGTL